MSEENVTYPFGLEGFEDNRATLDEHPSHDEMQSYSERSFRSLAEIGQDEFLKFEQHSSYCDECLLVQIKTRIRLLNKRAV